MAKWFCAMVVPRGISHLHSAVPVILEDADNGLSDLFRELLHNLGDEFTQLEQRIAAYGLQIEQLSEQSDVCRRLKTIPGIGPLGATALVAAAGDAHIFKNGREMSAWLGIVPKQYSTGGKVRLLGISKRGDKYLRKLIIHGARAVVRFADKKDDRLNTWVTGVKQRRGQNIATVALANKMIRMAWVIISRAEEEYRTFAVAK